jgi:hypothetical protein
MKGNVIMSNIKKIGVVCAVALLTLASRSARADEFDELMVFTFNNPVEIPGVVLPAGTYQFKLADPNSDRSVVSVLSANGSQVYATLITVADRRETPTDKAIVTFEERAAGAPQAIDSIFYPGELTGMEFIYPHDHQDARAASSKESR